jgi:hypothetical protein
VENWGSKIWTVGWVGKNSPSELCDCVLCFQTCGRAVSCWRRISATFLWGQTLLKRFCKFLRVWMNRSELMVWPHGIMSTKITPPASQKTVAMTFPAEGATLNFFLRGEVGWCPSIDCLLVSGSKWWIRVSSPSDDLWQKSFHYQPRDRRANLNTRLSAQFYDHRLGLIIPNVHTLLHILMHQ